MDKERSNLFVFMTMFVSFFGLAGWFFLFHAIYLAMSDPNGYLLMRFNEHNEIVIEFYLISFLGIIMICFTIFIIYSLFKEISQRYSNDI